MIWAPATIFVLLLALSFTILDKVLLLLCFSAISLLLLALQPNNSNSTDANAKYEGLSTKQLIETANRHKLARDWVEAGLTFDAAAQKFSSQARSEHDAAKNFAEAANCYRKVAKYRSKALKCLEKAARIYAEVGQFSIAARYLEEAGDLMKSIYRDNNDLNKAIRLYQQSADWWSGEDSPANASGSRTKAAELMADTGRLDEAVKVFEDLGVSSQSHSLLGFGAKDYIFKACLCLMGSQPMQLSEKAGDLASKMESFKDSDEFKLVERLVAAFEAQDASAFDAAVSDFKRFNNCDDFAVRQLDRLRKLVSGESSALV